MSYQTTTFIEADELRRLIDNADIYKAVILRTDYDHCEIHADTISDVLQNIEEYTFTAEQLADTLKNALGEEVYSDLMGGKLDFISVIY